MGSSVESMNIWADKTLLITGGTGSVGTEFVRFLRVFPPKRLIILSRDWLKQRTLKDSCKQQEYIKFVIGDVRDKDKLIRDFNGVDILIHAAALKDVESCEENPSETIRTNVQGTQNVIDACIVHGVSKCLLISTDKAVNPSCVYGNSKAVAEKLWLNAGKYSDNTNSKFSICRFGNIVGSTGSVVPIWRKLIKEGATILPVTDKRMTRFHFMPKDATDFIYSSITEMQGGEIFTPKLPSIRITDLARAFDVPYEEVGIRTGEKLHEIMFEGCSYTSETNFWFLSVNEIRESLKEIE